MEKVQRSAQCGFYDKENFSQLKMELQRKDKILRGLQE